jgi:hypothetical protein
VFHWSTRSVEPPPNEPPEDGADGADGVDGDGLRLGVLEPLPYVTFSTGRAAGFGSSGVWYSR